MLPFQEDFSLLLSVQSFLLLASNLPDTLFRDRQNCFFPHICILVILMYAYSLANTITFSTPLVQQNISTLCTFCTLYPFSTNSAASRACVATLQLT